MKREQSAGGVIVRRGSGGWQVLLIKDMNAAWTFPKGLIEPHETPRQTAEREIFEEVALTQLTFLAPLQTISYWYRRNGLIQKTVAYLLFVSNKRSVLRPQKQEGIQEAKWVSMREALHMIGYPETNKLLLRKAEIILRK